MNFQMFKLDLEKAEKMYRTAQKNHDLDNYDGVITHLETDILECEVKWTLESITTNKVPGSGKD